MQKEPRSLFITKNVMRVSLIVGIVLVFGIMGYLAINKNNLSDLSDGKTAENNNSNIDETADWKVYKNEVHGFEIKYPGDVLEAVEKSNSDRILESSDIAYSEESEVPKMHVSVGDIKTSVFQDAKNEAEDYYRNASFTTEGPEKESIAGQTVYVSTFKLYGGGEGISRKYYFPGFILVFSYANNDAEAEFMDHERKMLSKLKYGGGWETYRSDDLGIRFRYPKRLIVSADEVYGMTYVWTEEDYKAYQDKDATASPYFWLDIELLGGKSLTEYLDTKKNIEDKKTFVAGGQEVTSFHQPGMGSGTYHYYLAAGNEALAIGTSFADPGEDFMRILSTLRFVDASSGEEISSWQAYSSRQYGFELRYPGNELSVENKTGGDDVILASLSDDPSVPERVTVQAIRKSAYEDAKYDVDYSPAYAEVQEMTGPVSEQIGGTEVFVTIFRRYEEGDEYGFSRSYYFSDFVLTFNYADHSVLETGADIEKTMVSSVETSETVHY